MKFLMYLMLLITATNCGSSQQNKAETTETTTPPIEEQNDLLIGSIDKNDLQQAPHSAWFDPMYQSYKPDQKALKTIQENINDYDIKMFMGTWCADSQLEVPKFYKLLDLSNYDLDRLEVTAVQEDKTLPDGSQKEFDVIYVPTIIFFKDGEEVGRFVEYPQDELEKDVAKIVSGQEYEHSYQN
ncbi:MAG: thioredoxin family protein [Salinimicrobium sediminis]|nr:thioredoxin family protein [Salinimicrobium sediminis]